MRCSRIWFLWVLQWCSSLHVIRTIQTAAGMIQLKGVSLKVIWQAIYWKIETKTPVSIKLLKHFGFKTSLLLTYFKAFLSQNSVKQSIHQLFCTTDQCWADSSRALLEYYITPEILQKGQEILGTTTPLNKYSFGSQLQCKESQVSTTLKENYENIKTEVKYS